MAKIRLKGKGASVEISKCENIKVLECQRNLRLLNKQCFYYNGMQYKHQAFITISSGKPMVMRKQAVVWMAGAMNEEPAVHRIIDFATDKLLPVCVINSSSWHLHCGEGAIMLESKGAYLSAELLSAWEDFMLLADFILAYDGNAKVRSRIFRNGADMQGYGSHYMQVRGNGALLLGLPCAKDELMLVELTDEELKVNSDIVMAWSSALSFHVERSFIDVAERNGREIRYINVFKGTGSILLLQTQF